MAGAWPWAKSQVCISLWLMDVVGVFSGHSCSLPGKHRQGPCRGHEASHVCTRWPAVFPKGICSVSSLPRNTCLPFQHFH